MSHYLKDLLPSEEVVTKSESSRKMTSRRSADAFHRYALFEKPILRRGPDGRTYDEIDEDGKYISHFISQLSPLINSNLEPGVALLVRLLHSKGYLTMGSCQGHDDSKFRWVSMVFPEEHQLENFKKMVDGFNLPITWYDNFLNFKDKPKIPDDDGFQLALTWDQSDVEDRSLQSLRNQGYTEEELTKYLNIMYSRNEKKYHLVKMVIASKMGNKSLKEKLKWRWMYRKRDDVTEQLIEALNESPFVEI